MAGAIPRQQALRPSRSERPPRGFARAPPLPPRVPVSPGRNESRDANGAMTSRRMGQKSALTKSRAARNIGSQPCHQDAFLIRRHGTNRAFDAFLPVGLEVLPSDRNIHGSQSVDAEEGNRWG